MPLLRNSSLTSFFWIGPIWNALAAIAETWKGEFITKYTRNGQIFLKFRKKHDLLLPCLLRLSRCMWTGDHIIPLDPLRFADHSSGHSVLPSRSHLIIVTHYNPNGSSSLLRFHFNWFLVCMLCVRHSSLQYSTATFFLPCCVLFWQLIAVIALCVLCVCHFHLENGNEKLLFEHFNKRTHCLLYWHLCRYKSFGLRAHLSHSRWVSPSLFQYINRFGKESHMHVCHSSLSFDLFRHFGLTIAFVFGCWFCYLTKPIFNNRPNTGNNIIRLMTFVNKILSPDWKSKTDTSQWMGSWKIHKHSSTVFLLYSVFLTMKLIKMLESKDSTEEFDPAKKKTFTPKKKDFSFSNFISFHLYLEFE